jgi:hypothetical protein
MFSDKGYVGGIGCIAFSSHCGVVLCIQIFDAKHIEKVFTKEGSRHPGSLNERLVIKNRMYNVSHQ